MKSSVKIGIVAATVVAVLIIVVVVLLLSDREDSSNDDPAASDDTSETTVEPSPTATTPTEPPETLEPEASLTEPQDLADGGDVRVTLIESVTSQAEIPGETSGPAIRVTIEVTAGDEAVELGRVVVNAYYGDELTPAIAVSGPGVKAFVGTLEPGESFEGVQVFNIPPGERDNVTIEFGYGGSPKMLKFQGSVA